MKVQMQFFVAALLVSLFFFDGAFAGTRLGGWSPVDPKNKHVMEIGKYAVDEHNKQAKTDLKFDHVVKGESQVVSGINYRLTLAVVNGEQNYEAVVWEKAWEGYRNLTSFRLIAG